MKLIAYNDKFKEQIETYQVKNLVFTGLPQNAIKISQENINYHPVLLVNELNEICTFFILDYGDDKFKYTNNINSLLLRSFSTNERFLRKGYALTALSSLPRYVQTNYPDIQEITLGVNKRNVAAQKLYEKAGFKKESRTYIGKKGPQLIFSKAIL